VPRRTKTKALLELCQTLGVARVVVAVNKMDTVGWSQERFESIQHELRALLRSVRYAADTRRAISVVLLTVESRNRSALVQFVPVSGLHGANVVGTPGGDDLGWWSGPTLQQALDAPGPPQSLSIYKPLRVPVRVRAHIPPTCLMIAFVLSFVLFVLSFSRSLSLHCTVD
jgi:elongation factor 1 alpha-like protein